MWVYNDEGIARSVCGHTMMKYSQVCVWAYNVEGIARSVCGHTMMKYSQVCVWVEQKSVKGSSIGIADNLNLL